MSHPLIIGVQAYVDTIDPKALPGAGTAAALSMSAWLEASRVVLLELVEQLRACGACGVPSAMIDDAEEARDLAQRISGILPALKGD